jgi:hypothetical protein
MSPMQNSGISGGEPWARERMPGTRVPLAVWLRWQPSHPVIIGLGQTDPDSITLGPGFTRDVTRIGHFGTGNLEVVIGTRSDFERA